MHDDPFARAVERVQAAEEAEQATRRKRRQRQLTESSRTGFRIHVSVFIAANVLLIAIWASTWQFNDATGYPWFIYPLLGWGIGLAAHFAAVRNHIALPAEQPRPESAPPANEVPPSAPSAPSTVTELTRLAELHRSGSLSDEEFSAAKAKLLE